MEDRKTGHEPNGTDGRSSKRRLFLFVPFLLLLGLAVLSFFRISALEHDGAADELPNVLAGKPAPHISLPLLFAPAGEEDKLLFDSAAFTNAGQNGKVRLVNFWGSWCPPCRQEHPFLMSLANNPDFELIGINYKDSRENAGRFLSNFGNPFAQIGYDAKGRAAIDWGVYGPPETFILSKSGIILYRFVGPMNEASFREKILPVILRANSKK